VITLVRQAVRIVALSMRRWYLVQVYGMDIARSARISWGARLDRAYPKGVHIGEESYCTSGSLILAHDYCRDLRKDTYIGKRCFIGADAVILPGIRVGDSVIVGAGAVVTRDVPANCIVAGNPARVIRRRITTSRFGQLVQRPMHLTRIAQRSAPRARVVDVAHTSGALTVQGRELRRDAK
jgi:acetyltransferase-like isoleucine patch superfamily enzyme